MESIKDILCRMFHGKSFQSDENINDGSEITNKSTDSDFIDLSEYPDYELKAKNSKGRKLNIMTIADCHGSLNPNEVIISSMPDVVCFLGDNFYDDLELALRIIKEKSEWLNSPMPYMIGVTGNHDEKNILQNFPLIANMHQNICSVDAVRFGGFGGSIKYKNDDYHSLYTDEECINALSGLPCCDILITHDKPRLKKTSGNLAHSGFAGIKKYIEDKKPAFVLHGHLHEKTVTKYKDTVIRCCYRVENFKIEL